MHPRDFEKLVICHIRRESNFHNGTLVMAGAMIRYDYEIAGNQREKKTGDFAKSYDSRMQKRMQRLGRLGQKPTKKNYDCHIRIGNCAEQHACNRLLKNRNNRKDKLSQVHLSKAYNPRTLLTVKPCGNCQFIFNIHE